MRPRSELSFKILRQNIKQKQTTELLEVIEFRVPIPELTQEVRVIGMW
jgi:hypothetical protein